MIVLASKKTICICNNCGAEIEKSIYFTGTCSYCGGSDLHAKILTKNKFYDISNEVSSGISKPDYYIRKGANSKKVLSVILLIVNLAISTILVMMIIDGISHYFDAEYQKQILLSPDSHLRSYKLIKGEILDGIIYDLVPLIILIPLAILRIKKIISIITAVDCSSFFSKCKKPFVDVSEIPYYKVKKNYLKKICQSIKRRYLKNCTLEIHDNSVKVALAKKVVKDQCPTCGASITDAVYEDYICKYCGNKIMDVVIKK